MNSGSNPAKPSRLYAGSGSFPGGFPENQEEYQPPALTSQAREDVERLRAKVRAHNPGYVYSNGVSLPSQIPSVPELLDELAYNVRAARTDRAIPNTPLPEVEQSELAKAGFDWKVIADRAISALETGTRRPLPLANDPEAATIPGLDVIAASRHESEPAAPAEPEVSAPVDEVSQPEVTQPPSAAEADLAAAEPPLAGIETPEVDEAAAPEAVAATEFSQPEAAADATNEAEPNLMGETAATPAPPSPEPVDVALGEPAVLPEAEDIAPAEAPTAVEEIDLNDEDLADLDIDDVDLDDLEVAPEPPAPSEETAFEETLAQAEDLVSDRVYDEDVLEPEGNDDEQFVGDVEAEPATWVTPDTPVAAEPEVSAPADPDGSAQVSPEADTVPEVAPETAAQAEPEDLLSEDVDLEADLDDLDLDDLELDEFDETEDDSPEANETDAATEGTAPEEAVAEEPAPQDVSPEQETVEVPVEEEPVPVAEEAIPAAEVAEEALEEATAEEEAAPAEEEAVPAEEAPEAPAQEAVPEADAEDAVVFETPSEIVQPVEDTEAEPETPLPGSEAIGSEVEEPDAAEDAVEVEYVEVSEDYEPEPGEEIEYIEVEDTSETPGEAETEAVDSEESDLPPADETVGTADTTDAADAADNAETAEDVETDETGELPFEIPTVEGDIPQAMQEGYSGWKPMTAENATAVDEELFAQPDDEPEAKPAKRGFFAKLFGRNKANQTED